MSYLTRMRASCMITLLLLLAFGAGLPAAAQELTVTPLDLPIGRSYPITTPRVITRVSVANPEVADVVVIEEREVVINARGQGETDVLIWLQDGTRTHYRVAVHTPADRMQVVLYVKFAEVRRETLRQIGTSLLYRDGGMRTGTGIFGNDNVFDPGTGDIILPVTQFLTVLTDFNTTELLGFLEAEETRGNARTLAEPNLMAANREPASFLAGGELPIPVLQSAGTAGQQQIGIQYREFGVKLNFVAEVISDTLIKLHVTPEVSSLDYANAILLSGFRIPAFRTRRIESTVDVRRNESLIISGMFNMERERVSTGVPFLKDIPILGLLFSSTRWQRSESELIVVVTPVLVDPMRPRAVDRIRLLPDTTMPARDAIKERMHQQQPAPQPQQQPRSQPAQTPAPAQPPVRTP